MFIYGRGGGDGIVKIVLNKSIKEKEKGGGAMGMR